MKSFFGQGVVDGCKFLQYDFLGGGCMYIDLGDIVGEHGWLTLWADRQAVGGGGGVLWSGYYTAS